MSYVMVRLGSEGTTILIPVRNEVLERSTSQYTVTTHVRKLKERWHL
ncbi:hypothetical protein HID58_068313 [Brassica napus]|uniref:Uncharacterized protein n=1 Tax=Brassica napus TaxID=3708 RepID=A0ABQ7ZKY9_BRANA|nr:hypothetical protein HID58_068313 [Brassica napus]